jgi:hypothetical protein
MWQDIGSTHGCIETNMATGGRLWAQHLVYRLTVQLTGKMTGYGDCVVTGLYGPIHRGDTWPNHRAPHGTPYFSNVGWVKNLFGTPEDSNPRALCMGNDSTKSGYTMGLNTYATDYHFVMSLAGYGG